MRRYTIRGLAFPQGPPARPATQNNKPVRLHRALSAPMELYNRVSSEFQIQNAQASGVFGVSGTLTLQVGPAGLGNTWYPASAVISTTTGIFDSSQCSVYVGPSGLPTTLQGTVLSGGAGVISIAIPAMTPGLYVIAVWTGGTNGATATLNVTGTQTILMRS